MLDFTREEVQLCKWLLGINSVEIIKDQMGLGYSDVIDRNFFPYPGTVLQLFESEGIEEVALWIYKILKGDPLPHDAPDAANQLHALIYNPSARLAYGRDESYRVAEAINGYRDLVGNIGKVVCLRYLIQKAEEIQAHRTAHPGALPNLTSDWVKESIAGVVEELRGNRAAFSPDWFDIEMEKMNESKSKWRFLKSFHNMGRIFLLSRGESLERKISFYLNIDACRHLIHSFIKEGKHCETKLRSWINDGFSVRQGGALWLCVVSLLLKLIVGPFLLSGLLVSGCISLPAALLCDATRTFSITHPRTPLAKKVFLATLTSLDLIKDIMLLSLISAFISLSLLNTIGMSLFVVFAGLMGGLTIDVVLFSLGGAIRSFLRDGIGSHRRRPEPEIFHNIDLIDLERGGRPQYREEIGADFPAGFYPRYGYTPPLQPTPPEPEQQDRSQAFRQGRARFI